MTTRTRSRWCVLCIALIATGVMDLGAAPRSRRACSPWETQAASKLAGDTGFTRGLAGVAFAADASSSAPATRPVNDRCPVMPGESASPAQEIVFRGAAVRFCCWKCKDRFLLDPQAYVARLPHVPAATVGAAETLAAGGK